MNPYVIFWIVMAVVFLAVEAVTPNLVTIWFACGALGSLVTALLGGKIILQLVIFIIVTAVTLYFTRPLVKKFNSKKHVATNADALLGSECTVKEEINNLSGSGTVSVGGKIWTARSLNGEIIAVNERVEVVKIEGVKLMVKRIIRPQP